MRFCSENILRTALLGALSAACLMGENAAVDAVAVPSPRVMSVVRADARTGRLVRRIVV